ncbi:MAG: hypothetical protein AB1611_00505 [bacterium]
MGRPLVGKQAIAGFFGTGWRKVITYIAQGAPIIKGDSQNSVYEADQKMLENWWEEHIQQKLKMDREIERPKRGILPGAFRRSF